jgi:hypothetical protein
MKKPVKHPKHLLGRFMLWQIKTTHSHRQKTKARQRAAARKESEPMRKSAFVAVIAALAAAAGALVAIAVYLHRREKELDEYEHLLFSEDFNEETPDDDAAASAPDKAAPAQENSDKTAE